LSSEQVTPVNSEALIGEIDRLAHLGKVVRRDRQTGEWLPDYGTLGQEIGRSHSAFTATLRGGVPDTQTLRLLVAYGRRVDTAYSPIPLLEAMGLVTDEDVVTRARNLRKGRATRRDDSEPAPLLEQARVNLDLTPEELERVADVVDEVLRGMVRQAQAERSHRLHPVPSDRQDTVDSSR